MKLAPIVLFTYNRPWHVQQTVDALLKNQLAAQSDLIIYSDGPKNSDDRQKVNNVRRYIGNIRGFRNIKTIERRQNIGLGNSIITGVTETVNEYGRVIVLEDDLVTSPFFLQYINDALDLYEHQERVISIHGYIYPVSGKLPRTFFLRGADCLGWGTWKRGWDLFEINSRKLLEELKAKKLTRRFDFNGDYRFTRMLKEQAAGRSSSWAIRWCASAFLRERLTLYPGASLVRHIGNDGAGTNCGITNILDVKLTNEPIPVQPIDIVEDPHAKRIISGYLHSIKTPCLKAAVNYGKRYFTNLLGNPRSD